MRAGGAERPVWARLGWYLSLAKVLALMPVGLERV